MNTLPERLKRALEMPDEEFRDIQIGDNRSNAEVANEYFAPIHERLIALVESAGKLGLQCANIGNYGPMKIRPGECVCSTCEMKHKLTALSEEVLERIEKC